MTEAANESPGICCKGKMLTSNGRKKTGKLGRSTIRNSGAEKNKKCQLNRKKTGKKSEKMQMMCDGGGGAKPKLSPEEAKAKRMRRLALSAKREQEQLKMMFQASVDPYERPLKWWEPPHVKYAFSFSAVKSRLEALMGSNIVRLTDRKYMQTLIARIREDHENQQASRIQERKMREVMRTKAMILNRYMSLEEAQSDILQCPLFQLYLYCDSISKRPRKKRLPKKVKISESLYRLLYPEKLPEELQLTEHISVSEGSEEGEDQDSLSEEEAEEKPSRKKHVDESKNEYMLSRDEYDNLHYEADSVKKLKEIKTVSVLYAKANDIVGNLYAIDKTQRKGCEREQAQVVKESKEV